MIGSSSAGFLASAATSVAGWGHAAEPAVARPAAVAAVRARNSRRVVESVECMVVSCLGVEERDCRDDNSRGKGSPAWGYRQQDAHATWPRAESRRAGMPDDLRENLDERRIAIRLGRLSRAGRRA